MIFFHLLLIVFILQTLILTNIHLNNLISSKGKDKMGIIFRGGEKLQRGRGIGGVLKSIQALFKPKEKKRKVKLR